MEELNPEKKSSFRWQNKELAEKYVADTEVHQKHYQNYYNTIAHGLFADYCQPGDNILDIGCGTGLLGMFLDDRGCRVTACDISESMLKIFSAHKAVRPINLIRCTAYQLPVKAGSFDVVTAHRVLQHFPNWTTILKEMARCCKPDGLIVFNMFSSEHRRWASENGKKAFDSVFSDNLLRCENDPNVQFAVECSEVELKKIAGEFNLELSAMHPYCFLDKNQLIGHSVGTEEAKIIDTQFHNHLEKEEVMDFLAWLETSAVRFLPAVFSDKAMVVLKKYN